MLTKFKESHDYIKSQTSVEPTVGIILGTGLGGLVNEINIIDEINYKDLAKIMLLLRENLPMKQETPRSYKARPKARRKDKRDE